MADQWREGARSNDPADRCPKCPDGGRIVFGSDFKKFGRQSVRACSGCKTVYVNGEATGPLVVVP